MALSVVFPLDMTESSDVVDALQERGVEFAYSIETDGAFLYGSGCIMGGY